MKILWIIIFFTSLLIAVMMYLVILGGSKNKSNEEIQREDEEQINYLKNYKRNLYKELLLDNKLHEHLVKVDEETNRRVDNLIKELAEQENVTEELKANNQLEWVRKNEQY